MKKHELQMAVRAASRIARDSEFFLIGSQAVHAYCRRAPAEVLLSQECDLYPKNRPETASLLDSELGRGSAFAREHGFYVDIVTPDIAGLPVGWERRLKVFRVSNIRVYCLEIYDLIISKLAAGRLRDLEFTGALIRFKLAEVKRIRNRIRHYPIAGDRPHLFTRLLAVIGELNS